MEGSITNAVQKLGHRAYGGRDERSSHGALWLQPQPTVALTVATDASRCCRPGLWLVAALSAAAQLSSSGLSLGSPCV